MCLSFYSFFIFLACKKTLNYGNYGRNKQSWEGRLFFYVVSPAFFFFLDKNQFMIFFYMWTKHGKGVFGKYSKQRFPSKKNCLWVQTSSNSYTQIKLCIFWNVSFRNLKFVIFLFFVLVTSLVWRREWHGSTPPPLPLPTPPLAMS